MKALIAILLGVVIYLLYHFCPQALAYNNYRIYKEIKSIEQRVERLEIERNL